MAEIAVSSNKKSKGFGRLKKSFVRVDLTPMVDLGFLLITFFIITTRLSEPKSMKLLMPKDGTPTNLAESTALTVVPIANDVIVYYHGELNDALVKGNIGVTDYSNTSGIGSIIRSRRAQLQTQLRKDPHDLVLVIKPYRSSSYKNLVDIMDEVLINDVTRYALTDLSGGEEALLKERLQ